MIFFIFLAIVIVWIDDTFILICAQAHILTNHYRMSSLLLSVSLLICSIGNDFVNKDNMNNINTDQKFFFIQMLW